MKTNLSRLICLVLVILMSVAVFSACGKGETGTDASTDVDNTASVETEPIVEIVDVESLSGEGYKIAPSTGDEVSIQLIQKEGVRSFQVAEGTTVEAFFKVVTAEDTFTLKIFDPAGNEVTDKNAVIVDKSLFKVFDKDNKETKSIAIAVVSKEEIKETQDDAKRPTASGPTTPAATSLKGYKFKLGTFTEAAYKDASTETGKVNVAQLNRIKKTYNCTVDVVGYNSQTLSDTVVKESLSGQVRADVIHVSIGHVRAIARQKCAADFAKCTTLNKNTFKNGMTESATHNGKIYGVSYASMSANPMGILFNKQLVDKYTGKKDVIYTHYKAGTWNFDNFEAIAKACTVDTNGDGKFDIHGVTSNTNIIGMAMTSNAGGTALKVNERVEATMCNDKGIYACEWLKGVYNAGYWAYKPDIYVSVSSFANGDAAMFASDLSWYSQIGTTAEFDMGFVPMPKGPAQSNYITGAYNGGLFLVPKTNEKNINIVGTFLNELSLASPGHINAYIQNMKRSGLDNTACDVYKWSVSNTSPEYRTGPFDSQISNKVDTSITVPTKSPKQELEAIKSQAQKMCDDYYAPLY